MDGKKYVIKQQEFIKKPKIFVKKSLKCMKCPVPSFIVKFYFVQKMAEKLFYDNLIVTIECAIETNLIRDSFFE
jgi:hypothetical protein